MLIGTQFIAPRGFGDLPQGGRCYLLKSDGENGKVLLIRFDDGPVKTSRLQQIERTAFEAALADQLVVDTTQSNLPPWLVALEGHDFRLIDEDRRSKKILHAQRVEDRLGHLQAALFFEREILASNDPERALAKFARTCEPPQHPARFRTWFFTYLLFGRNKWALAPAYHQVGRWSRTEARARRKPGRRVLDGGQPGSPRSPEMDDKIVKAYQRLGRTGVPMSEIYRKSLLRDFGCKVGTGADGRRYHYHPTGGAFPSLRQFRWVCQKVFKPETIRQRRFGSARIRFKEAASKGRFCASSADLFEKVEYDAQQLKARPRSVIDGKPAAPLFVVRALDSTSGMVTGIGFGIGNEANDAYRMADFCSAIPKVSFARLFGVTLKDDEWPCIGLPLERITDRGPGHRSDLLTQAASTLAPAYSGQSKATVETRHEKHDRLEGRPDHLVSGMTAVQMIRSEINRTVAQNRSTDVHSRLTPNMVSAGVGASPVDIWRYLDSRGRTCGQSMSFAAAVRLYLTPIDWILNDGRLVWNGTAYWSKELNELGEFTMRQPVRTFPGYAISLCVRYAWLDLGDRLIEVEAELSLRESKQQLYMTADEAARIDSLRRERGRKLRASRAAELNEFDQRTQAANGRSPEERRVAGRPPKKSALRTLEARAMLHKPPTSK